MNFNWHVKEFDQLSAKELYSILKLRINVFMLEQNCLYPECDDKDLKATHLFSIINDQVVAYARLLPAMVSYAEPSIGRVVTHPDHRSTGLGKVLMNKSILHLEEKFPKEGIRISAQAHLQKFYESLLFKKVSEVYLEDNIPHIEMLKADQ